MTGLAVAADDRTGALETAAACADAGFTTRLHTHPAARYGTLDRLGADVVDLRTRHATPGEARTRAALAEAWPGGHHAHKIDSTLRGNWAVELAGRGGTVGIVPGQLPLDHGGKAPGRRRNITRGVQGHRDGRRAQLGALRRA